MTQRHWLVLIILGGALGLAGCAMPQRASSDGLGPDAAAAARPFGAQTSPNILRRPAAGTRSLPAATRLALPLLSPGDRVSILLEDGEEFEGSYAVGMDGSLRIPYLPPVSVHGLDVDAARSRLLEAFVAQGILTGHGPPIDLVPVLWAAVQVSVAGAVYSPGPVVINDRTHVETRPDLKTRSGDLAPDRYFSAALRASGGVRPDADISNAVLIRDGIRRRVDLRPMLDGSAMHQPALLAGDVVEVPSVGVFQEPLARPSSITAPGFRIYVSNLSIPSPSNAQSAVAGEATRMPTGARLSHALASANCIGGTQGTNAGRSALLVSHNPITSRVSSHLYRVHDVTRFADEPRHNPYLLPEDAIACFDASVTLTRDLARTALDLLAPVELLQRIRNGDFRYD